MSFDLPGLVAEEPGAEPDAMLLVPGGRGGWSRARFDEGSTEQHAGNGRKMQFSS